MNAINLNTNIHLNNVDNSLVTLKSITKNARLLGGLVGLIIVSPISLLIRGYLRYSLQSGCKKFRKNIQKSYSMVPRLSESELVDYHLRYENIKKSIYPHILHAIEATEKMEHQSLTKLFYGGIIYSLKELEADIIEAELKFKQAAYPEIVDPTPLTVEQIELLRKNFSNPMFQDWEDPQLDVYLQIV